MTHESKRIYQSYKQMHKPNTVVMKIGEPRTVTYYGENGEIVKVEHGHEAESAFRKHIANAPGLEWLWRLLYSCPPIKE